MCKTGILFTANLPALTTDPEGNRLRVLLASDLI
jgi:hypothetical protein